MLLFCSHLPRLVVPSGASCDHTIAVRKSPRQGAGSSKNLGVTGEQNRLGHIHDIGVGRRSTEMRHLPILSLNPLKFVQAFAAGLRAEFADAACAPVPDYLAALISELDGDQTPPIASLPPGNSKSAPKLHSSVPT
jgi:hypothetical protein